MKQNKITVQILVLTILLGILILSTDVVQAKEENNFKTGVIVGYDVSKEKEIFGDRTIDEINQILNSITHQQLDNRKKYYEEINMANKNQDDIDYSKIFISSLNNGKELVYEKDELDNSKFSNIIPFEDNPDYLAKTFRYLARIEEQSGREIASFYKTTVHRYPISQKIGVRDMYTRQDSNQYYGGSYAQIPFKHSYYGASASVKFRYGLSDSMIEFTVLNNGNIVISSGIPWWEM